SKPGPTNSPPANSNNSKSPPRTDVATTLCLRVPHPWFVRVGSYDRRPPYFLIFSLWSAAPWRRFRAFNPSYQPSSRPERPDFFLRADFWRVGPRSAVCAPRALRRGGGISLLPSSSAFLFCLPLLPSSSAFLFCLPLLPSSSAFLFCRVPHTPGLRVGLGFLFSANPRLLSAWRLPRPGRGGGPLLPLLLLQGVGASALAPTSSAWQSSGSADPGLQPRARSAPEDSTLEFLLLVWGPPGVYPDPVGEAGRS